MKINEVYILEDRGLLYINGEDSKNFLQNIITNDIKKVSNENSIFAAILTPQGKYLNEFFIVKNQNGYLLDCSEESTEELIKNLYKYKLRSKIEIENLSSKFVVGVISPEKFQEMQKETKLDNTIYYRGSPVFSDPRNKKLGARILSNLDKLYLTIKKLKLKIIDSKEYYSFAHKLGIPEKGLKNLTGQLFGLEANFELLNAIDFKKGCFVGQENTARMRLKKRLRRRLVSIKAGFQVEKDSDIFQNNQVIGKVLIDKPYPFGLIKYNNEQIENLLEENLFIDGKKVSLISINKFLKNEINK